MPNEQANETPEAIVTVPADPQGEAFPVEGEGYKNTNSLGGILAIIFFLFCLFFVAEAIVHIIFKKKRRRKEGRVNDHHE